MAKKLNRLKLLEKLPRIEYDALDSAQQDQLQQMSLAGAMLSLAQIDPETEYSLCRAAAEHLLGKVYQPEDIQLEE